MKHKKEDGYKFTLDNKTGYYLSTKKINGKRLRLHVYVWLKHNGPIPLGYAVHHVDENKENNEIDNLVLISDKYHQSLHSTERMDDPERYNNQVKHLARIRNKASEWHKSKKGKEWHKIHYEIMKDKLHEEIALECQWCHKTFKTKKHGAKYCSISCRNKAHYYNDDDKEFRKCIICGEQFLSNKWRKQETCGRKCGAILGHRRG